MSQAWLAQRERGTLSALRLIAWITRRLGYTSGRALLHPIVIYFLTFSRRAPRASRNFLTHVTGRPATWGDVYRHYLTFATTILDRVLLLAGRIGEFRIAVHGGERVLRDLEQGRGLLLIGSHVGSFELCRAVGLAKNMDVNIVMHEGNAGKIAAWMREASPTNAPKIIAPGDPDTMLKIRDALARNEIVAMLGDRPIGRSETLRCDFLGRPAQFPIGPLRLALALNAPTLLFFGLHRAPRDYDVYFEPLTIPQGDRRSQLETLVRAYVARLEHHTRDAPLNWFNFYEFWETGPTDAKGVRAFGGGHNVGVAPFASDEIGKSASGRPTHLTTETPPPTARDNERHS
ncbi:MAG TPA: hypothetical protein VNE58_06825 [Casimicrobiaceae bacterium]|nr:hypothetical protein [Casimicrobiaceae bacterium]